MEYSGVFSAVKKDGSRYFRASITYKDKHISLGSFSSEEAAGVSYALASEILRGEKEYLPEDYECTVCQNSSAEEYGGDTLKFDKWIMLLNLKNTGMYCKNPIYLYGKYFDYYLDRHTVLKFDADELFFFRNHRIQKRGGHLFYSDFGMQCSLLSRYGVRSFAVEGRDYIFKNGDLFDFRFGNLEVINKYFGVREKEVRGRTRYEVVIHVQGNVSVGVYSSDVEGAVAYNKAADSLEEAVRRKKSAQGTIFSSTNVDNNILGDEKRKGTIYLNSENSENIIDGYSCSTKTQDKNQVNTRSYKDPEDKKQAQKQLSGYRKWQRNYIESISKKEYLELYERVKFKKSFKRYLEKM